MCGFIERIGGSGAARKGAAPSRKRSALVAHRMPSDIRDYGDIIERVVGLYHESLSRSKEAMDYLSSRGLGDPETLRRYRVGFADGRLEALAKSGTPTRRALRELGYINARGKEHFAGRVVWPIEDATGAIVGAYGRRLSDQAPEHFYLPGPHRGVWNLAGAKVAATSGEPVVLVESVIDAHSCVLAGLVGTVALYGTEGFTSEHVEMLTELRPSRVVLMLDGDDGGRRAEPVIIERLRLLGLSLFVARLPEGDDPNETLTKAGAEALRQAADGAEPVVRRSIVVRRARRFQRCRSWRRRSWWPHPPCPASSRNRAGCSCSGRAVARTA